MGALTSHAINFTLNTRWEDLPDEVQHQAKRCLLDTLGALIAVTALGGLWLGVALGTDLITQLTEQTLGLPENKLTVHQIERLGRNVSHVPLANEDAWLSKIKRLQDLRKNVADDRQVDTAVRCAVTRQLGQLTGILANVNVTNFGYD